MRKLGALLAFAILVFVLWEILIYAISTLHIPSIRTEYDLTRTSSLKAVLLSPSTNNQREPAIYDNKVVWSEYIGNYWQIILYDLSTKTRTQLTNNSLDHIYPSISGDNIIWWEGESGGADRGAGLNNVTLKAIVFPAGQTTRPKIGDDGLAWIEGGNQDSVKFFSFSDGQTRTLRIGSIENWPANSDGRVVWTDYRARNPDIYGYDLAAQLEFPITVDPNEQDQPDISGNTVVWQDNRRTGSLNSFDICGYDLASSQEFIISARGGNEVSPKVSDNFVVWTDYVASNVDVYAFDITTKKLVTVAADNHANYQPAIFKSTIVWTQQANSDRDALSQIVMSQIP